MLGGSMFLLFVVLIFWSLYWKGTALWRAARNGDKGWYIVMLIVNTAGILEILYLYVFSDGQTKPAEPAKQQ